MRRKIKGGRYDGYVAAQRAWDVRYGDVIKRAQHWRLFALGLLACCVLLIFGMINLSSKSRIVPYVVAIDAIGRAEAVSPAEAAAPVDRESEAGNTAELDSRRALGEQRSASGVYDGDD